MSDDGGIMDPRWEGVTIPTPQRKCERCERRAARRNPYERVKSIALWVLPPVPMVALVWGWLKVRAYAIAINAGEPWTETVVTEEVVTHYRDDGIDMIRDIGYVVVPLLVVAGLFFWGYALAEWFKERERRWERERKELRERKEGDQ